MKKIVSALFIAVSLLAVDAYAVSSKLSKKQVLRISNGAEPKELDPSLATGAPEGNILDSLFEGLIALDPMTMKPGPGMAESWKVSKDGKTYTFKIRKNAKWSDGMAITARDFVWSWSRALAPKTASEYAYQLFYVKNGKAFNEGKVKDVKKLGIKAKDKHTLVVTLENPTPFFLNLCAFRTLYPTPKHVIEKHPGQEWTREGNMVSNGPFKLAEWKLNRHIKVVKNDKYWDAKNVVLKEALFLPIEQPDTAEKSFFAGQLEMTTDVPPMKIPLYQKQMAKNPSKYHPYQSNPYLGIYYYRFNVKKKPTNNPLVRKALAMVIDRKLLVERVLRGGQIPATAFTPPNTGGYTYSGDLPISVTPAHVKKAKALLKKAGYSDPQKMPKLEILYNTVESHKKVAIAIQQMWKKHLGITTELVNQEWKVYLNSQKSGNYIVSRAGWIGDYYDPNTFLDLWLTGGGNNQTGWSSKKYDSFIAQANRTLDTKKRHNYFAQAEKILMEELPVMPIYVYTNNKLIDEKVRMVKNGRVHKWKSNIQDILFLKHLALAK